MIFFICFTGYYPFNSAPTSDENYQLLLDNKADEFCYEHDDLASEIRI